MTAHLHSCTANPFRKEVMSKRKKTTTTKNNNNNNNKCSLLSEFFPFASVSLFGRDINNFGRVTAPESVYIPHKVKISYLSI